MTLNLKRIYKGHYEVSQGDLNIKVVNPYRANGMGGNYWQIVIEFYNGKEEDYIYISEFFDTKKECSTFGAKWVIDNF
jgi:hypothetical protein